MSPAPTTYSEFFSSGLRAIRGARSRSGSQSRVENPPAAAARYNLLRSLSYRSTGSTPNNSAPTTPSSELTEYFAPSSPIISSPLSRAPVENIAPKSKAGRKAHQHHRRRSTIIDIPARIFGEIGRAVSSATPTTTSVVPFPSAGSDSNVAPLNIYTSDPFGASPFASSFFTEAGATPGSDAVPSSDPVPSAKPAAHQPRPRRVSLLGMSIGAGERISKGSNVVVDVKAEPPAKQTHTRDRSRSRRFSLPIPLPVSAPPFASFTKPSALRSPQNKPARPALHRPPAFTRTHTSPVLGLMHMHPIPSYALEYGEYKLPLDLDLEAYNSALKIDAVDIGTIDWREFHAQLPVLLMRDETVV
ncbi:hypothetical protein MKEN_00709600 [Mycena kentingensis (nom. inval.)]|nr:hypothetical protein MKEN_00709600 [Mycena kentingensis (nom. inval.)]